jgi:hypothetical protein
MEAFPTGDAVFFPSGFHVGGKTMLSHLENIRSWHIHTGLDAAETHHASIKPLPDQRGSVGNGRKFSFLRRILVFLDAEFIGSILELALSPGIAHRTVQRVVDQQ